MSRYLRNRKTNYDNIAVGSATGVERLKGSLTTEIYSRDNVASGSAFSTTDPHENLGGTDSKDGENVDTTSGST